MLLITPGKLKASAMSGRFGCKLPFRWLAPGFAFVLFLKPRVCLSSASSGICAGDVRSGNWERVSHHGVWKGTNTWRSISYPKPPSEVMNTFVENRDYREIQKAVLVGFHGGICKEDFIPHPAEELSADYADPKRDYPQITQISFREESWRDLRPVSARE